MMLTGRRSDRDEELARFAGANGYMEKPFDPDQLVFRVDEMLARTAPCGTVRTWAPMGAMEELLVANAPSMAYTGKSCVGVSAQMSHYWAIS